MDNDFLTQKAKGALIGLAVGDAIGDIGRDPDFMIEHGLVTHMPTYARSTDDTEFALLTARTLIDNHGKLSTQAVLESWQKYIIEQGGIYERAGRPLYGAVENLKRGVLPPYSGIDNVFNDDDGAAMRIAPVGIVYAGQPERASQYALIESQISHDKDGIWAAQAVASSIAVAMIDATPDEIIAAGRAQIPEDSWLGRAMERAMNICDQANTIREAWEPLHTQLYTPERAAAAEAIPQTYALFRLCEGDFMDVIFWSSNFGRDADTIAAVVGAMAGALGGIDVIPAEWVEIVRKPCAVCLKFTADEDIIDLAQDLAKLIQT